MAEQRLLGVYADPAAAARAVAALRGRGFSGIETFAPVPDAGLQQALGAPDSPVRVFTFTGAALGGTAGLSLATFTSLQWPLITGGKAIVALPAFLLIGYETTILLGALGTLLGFLVHARLPRRPGPAYDARFSSDHFGVLVTTATPEQDAGARELLAGGAVEVRVA